MVISPRHHEEMLILVHLAEEKKKKSLERNHLRPQKGAGLWQMVNGELGGESGGLVFTYLFTNRWTHRHPFMSMKCKQALEMYSC